MVSPQSPHDNAYKHVFSHPRAVADLLRGFVHEDWVTQLDYTTLEKVSGSYVTDDLRDREDDIIWRLRMSRAADVDVDADAGAPGEWVYVYLLLEFQSSNDPYMAVRILTYVGLLYQDLIKSGRVTGGRLPAVFPLVLYNGMRPWTAERQVADLIEPVPASLSAYRPSLRYFLMDEGRLPQTSLAQPDNAVASMVELERSGSPAEISQVVGRLVEKLEAPQNRELRRALAVWIRRLVLRRFAPEGDVPELQDLPETHHMISERVDSWTQEWLRQGMQQGMQKGIQQGMQQGMQQGLQQGLQQGKQQGMRDGQAVVLRELLTQRFGTLPPEIEARLEQASLDQLRDWFPRILTAQSLAAVFAGQ